MPSVARDLIAASAELHRRVARLDVAQAEPAVAGSPARAMMERLRRAI
jgi:regulator of CtrA degradation